MGYNRVLYKIYILFIDRLLDYTHTCMHTHTHTTHTYTHKHKHIQTHTHTNTYGPQAPSIPKPFLRQTVFRGQTNTESSTSSLAKHNANCTVKTITNSHNQCPASILQFPPLWPIHCDANFLSDILTAAKS